MPLDERQIGARIRELRTRAGLDQAALGKILGMDQSGVSRMEKGLRQVTALDLVKLSSGLGVSIEDIMSPEMEQPALMRSQDEAETGEALRLLAQCINEFRGLEYLDS